MDDRQFDRLTRRFVLGGLTSGALVTLGGREESAAAKLSKRKRCKRKNREFCDGRCCPRPQRCENKTCVSSCDDQPFSCAGGGGSCGAEDECFCTTTVTGKATCVNIPLSTNCNSLQACTASDQCPAGEVCVFCACPNGAANIRCAPPC